MPCCNLNMISDISDYIYCKKLLSYVNMEVKVDGFVNLNSSVTPAKAGVQGLSKITGSRLSPE